MKNVASTDVCRWLKTWNETRLPMWVSLILHLDYESEFSMSDNQQRAAKLTIAVVD